MNGVPGATIGLGADSHKKLSEVPPFVSPT